MALNFHHCSSLSPLAPKMNETQGKSEKGKAVPSTSLDSIACELLESCRVLSMQTFGIWKVAPTSLLPLSQTTLNIQLGTRV